MSAEDDQTNVPESCAIPNDKGTSKLSNRYKHDVPDTVQAAEECPNQSQAGYDLSFSSEDLIGNFKDNIIREIVENTADGMPNAYTPLSNEHISSDEQTQNRHEYEK